MTPEQKPGRSKQDYGTPPEFLDAVRRTAGIEAFDLDLAADATNARAARWYDEAADSLTQPWDGLHMWLNPPFGRIVPWVAKCAQVSRERPEARIYLLTPASIGANWFADHVHKRALVLALSPRLTFEGMDQPFPKDCILSIYGEPSGFETWRWL